MTKLSVGAVLFVALMNCTGTYAEECGQTIDGAIIQKLHGDLNAQRKTYSGISDNLSQAVMDAGKSGKAKRMEAAANDIDMSVEIYRQTDPVLRYLEHIGILAKIKAEMIDERDRKIVQSYLSASAVDIAPLVNRQVDVINSLLANSRNPALLREGARLRSVVEQVSNVFSACTPPTE